MSVQFQVNERCVPVGYVLRVRMSKLTEALSSKARIVTTGQTGMLAVPTPPQMARADQVAVGTNACAAIASLSR